MTGSTRQPAPGPPPGLLPAALYYAARGWPVLPLHNPTEAGCSCPRTDCTNPGKHPRARRGLHAASTSPETIARWWTRWPDANIGVATVRLVVIDVDGPAGQESLTSLQRDHQRLPATLRAGTARGAHLYFTVAGQPVSNSAGRLGPGLDVRGRGGYVIAPPSRHPTGLLYRWLNNHTTAPLPSWLAGLLTPPPADRSPAPPPGADRTGERAARYALAAMHAEAHEVATAPAGTRNDRLNRAAFALGQLANAVDTDRVTDTLLAAAIAAGLGEREALATIASGLAAGQRHPRRTQTPPAQRSPTSLPPAREPASRGDTPER